MKKNNIKKWSQFLNEESQIRDIWEEGFENTKTFVLYLDHGIEYIRGCSYCDEITPLVNQFKERQYVGNVYQSLCNCAVCGKYIVYDEHNFDKLENYLENKDKLDAENKSNIKKGLKINITYSNLSKGITPTEIVKCKPFPVKTVWHRDEMTMIDTLYVYVNETYTNDLFDNPLNNYMQMLDADKHNTVTIDLQKNRLYSPYPESEIDRKFPKEVAKVFKKYINKYCK